MIKKKTPKKTTKKKPKAEEGKYKTYKSVPRNKLRYPTFEPQRAVANRREELEIDYVGQLNETEKDWLNRFQEEYVCANFQHKGELVDKTDEYRKERYRSNNHRNSDIYINAKVRGLLTSVATDSHLEHYMAEQQGVSQGDIEDALIDMIDRSRSGEPSSDEQE